MKITKDAILSPLRNYRYVLTRQWDADKPYVAFIGLNPSTADEYEDDPTIRRCIGFAKSWGMGGVVMLNLFGFRATEPRVMMAAAYPVGEDNDRHIFEQSSRAEFVIACWGGLEICRNRAAEVEKIVPNMLCLKQNQNGSPRHPLYVRKDCIPMIYIGEDTRL
jgi:hypothetical protein